MIKFLYTFLMVDRLAKELENKVDSDLYEIGYASLAGLLHPKWKRFPYGISLLRKLDDDIIDGIQNGPTEEYYSYYHEINNELNRKCDELVEFLKENNVDAVAIKATLADSEIDEEYQKTLRYSLSHKMVATRAGLGWIGKSDLLVSFRFGPRVRLSSILTSTHISTKGKPIVESQCGKCNLCVMKCPAEVANGKAWQCNLDRDEFYNPFKCREFAKEISERNIQKKISLCGICISVCPIGKITRVAYD